MSQLGKVMKTGADAVCDHVRAEAEATDVFVRDVQLFLDELPLDLGKGSLNGMRAQLRQKCLDYLKS